MPSQKTVLVTEQGRGKKAPGRDKHPNKRGLLRGPLQGSHRETQNRRREEAGMGWGNGGLENLDMALGGQSENESLELSGTPHSLSQSSGGSLASRA